MLMAQAIRPPASPVGSVLSDTHSMSPGNGASSSILPGSEEGIGGRHGCPTRSRSPSSTTSGSKTLLTSMLDDTGLRLAVEQAMAQPKTAALLPAHQQPSLWRRRGASSRSAPRKASRSTRQGTRQRGPSDHGSQGRAQGPNAAGAREGDAALTGARTCFRPCCRTKMSACQGYRWRSCPQAGQEGLKVSDLPMQILIKIAFKG